MYKRQGQRFDVTHFSKQIKEEFAGKTHEELEEMAVPVKIAGRIMTKRRKGKVCFMHIQDLSLIHILDLQLSI